MYGGVGPEVRFGTRKDSDWVSAHNIQQLIIVNRSKINKSYISILYCFPVKIIRCSKYWAF